MANLFLRVPGPSGTLKLSNPTATGGIVTATSRSQAGNAGVSVCAALVIISSAVIQAPVISTEQTSAVSTSTITSIQADHTAQSIIAMQSGASLIYTTSADAGVSITLAVPSVQSSSLQAPTSGGQSASLVSAASNLSTQSDNTSTQTSTSGAIGASASSTQSPDSGAQTSVSGSISTAAIATSGNDQNIIATQLINSALDHVAQSPDFGVIHAATMSVGGISSQQGDSIGFSESASIITSLTASANSPHTGSLAVNTLGASASGIVLSPNTSTTSSNVLCVMDLSIVSASGSSLTIATAVSTATVTDGQAPCTSTDAAYVIIQTSSVLQVAGNTGSSTTVKQIYSTPVSAGDTSVLSSTSSVSAYVSSTSSPDQITGISYSNLIATSTSFVDANTSSISATDVVSGRNISLQSDNTGVTQASSGIVCSSVLSLAAHVGVTTAGKVLYIDGTSQGDVGQSHASTTSVLSVFNTSGSDIVTSLTNVVSVAASVITLDNVYAVSVAHAISSASLSGVESPDAIVLVSTANIVGSDVRISDGNTSVNVALTVTTASVISLESPNTSVLSGYTRDSVAGLNLVEPNTVTSQLQNVSEIVSFVSAASSVSASTSTSSIADYNVRSQASNTGASVIHVTASASIVSQQSYDYGIAHVSYFKPVIDSVQGADTGVSVCLAVSGMSASYTGADELGTSHASVVSAALSTRSSDSQVGNSYAASVSAAYVSSVGADNSLASTSTVVSDVVAVIPSASCSGTTSVGLVYRTLINSAEASQYSNYVVSSTISCSSNLTTSPDISEAVSAGVSSQTITGIVSDNVGSSTAVNVSSISLVSAPSPDWMVASANIVIYVPTPPGSSLVGGTFTLQKRDSLFAIAPRTTVFKALGHTVLL